jgi:uncharacterized protein YbbC (DUF1343 family)
MKRISEVKMNQIKKFILIFLLLIGGVSWIEASPVQPGIDVLFDQHREILNGSKIGLLTTSSMLDASGMPSYQRFKKESQKAKWKLAAFFAPEHGFWSGFHASEKVEDEKDEDGFKIFSLHGASRRPDKIMLNKIDLMVVDLIDVGTRCYTYASTLFYVMEECAKNSIPVIVLDRPNPINGVIVDGPCLEPDCRSFVGYIDVPFCHGMTIAELATFFNVEYRIGCSLVTIPMKGWKREMSYKDTGLIWLGSSPQLPEGDSALYYPMTNILGDLCGFNTGVGYTQPFKILGHPKADAKKIHQSLMTNKLSGVDFYLSFYKPFFGSLKTQLCQGVRLFVRDPIHYQPFQTQLSMVDTLRQLYPKLYQAQLDKLNETEWQMLSYLFGTKKIKSYLRSRSSIRSSLNRHHQKRLKNFLLKRKLYLIPSYK